MPDDPAFIRKIADNPDDDTPRLVYADVLEETGEPLHVARAEFIRLDIERHRLPQGDPSRRELDDRARGKLMEHALDWWRELPSPQGVAWDWFVRGFAERLQGSLPVFLAHAASLFEAAPLRHVRLVFDSLESVPPLAGLSQLERLCTLKLAHQEHLPWPRHTVLGETEAAALANSPHLKGLASFRVQASAASAAAQSILRRRFGSSCVRDQL